MATIAEIKALIASEINFNVNVADSVPYTRNAEIPSDCLSIEFINVGTVDATINGRRLLAGSPPFTISVSGGATIRTVFKLSFDTAGAGCNVTVTHMYKQTKRKC